MKSLILFLIFSFFSYFGFSQGNNPEIEPKVFYRVKPSIVTITTGGFGEKEYLGSGTVVSEGGIIATNYSAIVEAENVVVGFSGGLTYPVRSIIYHNSRKNLVLLEINALGLPKVNLSDSYPKVGEIIYCFSGKPREKYGFSAGVISGINKRGSEEIIEFISSLPSVSKGSPLINSKGEALGIVTSVADMNQNFNQALPFRYIKPYLDKESSMSFPQFRELVSKGEVYLKSAVEAHSNQQYQEAVELLESFLAIDASQSEAYHLLGLSFHKLKNYRQALSNYKKALEINPEYILVYNDLAIAYLERGQPQEAIAAYRKILDLNPGSVEAWRNLGQIYIDLEMYQEALVCYRRVLKLNPDSISTYMDLGWIYAVSGDYESSISYFKEYINHYPNNPEVYFKLGLVYFEAKDMPAAKRNFLKARNLAKEYGRIQLLENVEKALTATKK